MLEKINGTLWRLDPQETSISCVAALERLQRLCPGQAYVKAMQFEIMKARLLSATHGRTLLQSSGRIARG